MNKVDWKHKGDACPCPSCKIRRGEEPAPPITQRSYETQGSNSPYSSVGKVVDSNLPDCEIRGGMDEDEDIDFKALRELVKRYGKVEMPLVSEYTLYLATSFTDINIAQLQLDLVQSF